MRIPKRNICSFAGYFRGRPPQKINLLMNDYTIDGVLVQMPLPKGIGSHLISLELNPCFDVGCLTPWNIGLMYKGNPDFLPCTPGGIIKLLNYYGVCLSGKHCVIVGRSDIVGKPMALLALQNDATVTICHSHTQKLSQICKTADILISAIGRKKHYYARRCKTRGGHY